MPTFSCCPNLEYPQKISGVCTTAGPAAEEQHCFWSAFGLLWDGSKWTGSSPNGGQITGNAQLFCGVSGSRSS